MTNNHLRVEELAVEPFMKNGYLLICQATGNAAYVDPGDEAQSMLDLIQKKGFELSCVLVTHGHLDHISGVGLVKKRWNVPVYLHREDEFLFNSIAEQGAWLGLKRDLVPPPDRFLEAGQRIPVGNLEIEVLHTPGHSPGSVSLKLENRLFCGDLLFAGSIGRTDLPGGSYDELIETLRSKVVPLGRDCIVYPGHGPSTTVGRELDTNPFLREL